MRARKRIPEPLNFTPDEKSPRETARNRAGAEAVLKPLPKKAALAKAETNGPAPDATQASGQTAARTAPALDLARHAYAIGAVAAVAWAGMLIAYEVGYVRGWNVLLRTPSHLAVLLALALLPGLFILAAAFSARQGARLAAEARWTHSLANELITPAVLAAARTSDIVSAVRAEVERASMAALVAHDQLVAVRESLAAQTDRLTETAAEAQRTARVVGETLTQERQGVTALLATLNASIDDLSEGVERQTRLVTETSDLARSQLQEAEATLAAGAASLATAGVDASAAAENAGDALVRQSERLDVAAAALSERLRFLDARLTDQRNALSTLAQGLEADEEDIAVRLESHRAQLMDVIAESRAGASDLAHASDVGAEALRALAAAAAAQIDELVQGVRTNRTLLASEAQSIRAEAEADLRQSLAALADVGDDARATATTQSEAAREAANGHVAAARLQIEQLGQLAFDAGQRANQAFDARIADARRLIEQAASVVEDAGLNSARRIETGLDAARGALGDLSGALTDIDAKMSSLPEAARRQVDGVRIAVERGLGELTAAARKASEETQAIDATFQDRIRRNYDSLSEAVRLMSRVAGTTDSGLAPTLSASKPQPAPKLDGAASPVPAAVAPAPDPAPATPPSPANPFAAVRWGASPSSTVSAPPVARPETVFPQERRPVFATARSQPSAPDLTASFDEPATAVPSPVAVPVPELVSAVAEPGLRPRLKLTPTLGDEALKAVFESAAAKDTGAAASVRRLEDRAQMDGELDEWTWKDLLSSMDQGPTDTDSLAEQMIREIEALGVDSAALLPPVRVEQLVEALLDGDAASARDALRRLAPAAIRRLSRRVLTDKDLREQADRFVARYDILLRDAAERDDSVRTAAGLLSSDAGRAYLLLDAAVGDL